MTQEETRESLDSQLNTIRRRKNILEQQIASFGYSYAPSHKVMELEDCNIEIVRLQKLLTEIEVENPKETRYSQGSRTNNTAINIEKLVNFLKEANAKGNWEKVIELGEKILKKDKNQDAIRIDTAYAYLWIGTDYGRNQRYDVAIKTIQKSINLDPKFALAYYNLGLAYSRSNQQDLAIANFTKAIENEPKFPMAYNDRANCYMALTNFPAAIEDYNSAIRIDPEFLIYYSNRGNCFANLTDYESAIQDYTKAIELDLDFELPYFNRGNTYWEIKRLEKAISDYNKYISLVPNASNGYYKRGVVHKYNGDVESAQNDFLKAYKLGHPYANWQLQHLKG